MNILIKNTDNRGVLTLTMNRPEVHNAFDADLIEQLTATLKAATNDEAVRLVVITGSGNCFSAGADLNWMRGLVDASLEENEADAMRLAKLIRCLNYLPKPTIAMINGSAFGGGVGLITACDISISVEDALFGLTEARLGLAPAVISAYVIRRIGEHHARRYFLSGERFDAKQALSIGLLHEVVTTGDLEQHVDAIIDQLLKSGPEAVKQCKQLVFEIAGHNRKTQKTIDGYTSRLIAKLRVSTEGQEGLAAFLEKRRPDWINPK
jgi:methylglutaconyl-CoA hydratase